MRIGGFLFCAVGLAWSCGGSADGGAADDGSDDAASDNGEGSGGNAATGGQSSGPPPSGADITRVVFEIDYASGAEPYVAGTPSGRDPFALSEVNLGRLFQGKELSLPHELGDMEELDDTPAGPYSAETILEIAAAHRGPAPAEDTASYYVVWLDGYYFDPDTQAENRAVLGVSLGGTSVMAMFKPVIRTAEGGLLSNKAPYVEQTTFIHELGHAAGLVNNGFEMVTPHQDEPHGAHCENPDCVMYYLNEGVDALSEFVQIIGEDETPILFDEDCLADVDAANAL